jgi:uncharacterized protein (TIGR02466 family)
MIIGQRIIITKLWKVNMTTTNLFSTPIMKKNLNSLNLDKFRERIITLIDTDDYGDHISVKGMAAAKVINTFGIEKAMHLWPETEELVENVNQSLKEYWKILNYHPALKPFINEMWATISFKEGYVPSHFHGPSPINAIFYLDKTEYAGNLVFQNPLELVLGSQPINFPFDEFAHVENLTQGDLILFPGYIRHSTEVNYADGYRISIGMNIGSTGKYITSQWINK